MRNPAARRNAFVCLALLAACRDPVCTKTSRPAPAAGSSGHQPTPSTPSASIEPQRRAPIRSDPSTRCDLSAIASFTGEIRDDGGRSLCGATVVIESPGEWWQQYLPREPRLVGPYERPGAFRITASRPGYRPAAVDVQVTSDTCHVQTRFVRLTLQHVTGTPRAPACEDFASMLAAVGALAGPGPYDNLPESPIPFVTRVATEGLHATHARRIAALQPRFQECWEQNLPDGETLPFYLGFTAQVFVNGRVAVETPTRDDPNQVPVGLRACIARELSLRELLPPSGSASFSVYLGFR